MATTDEGTQYDSCMKLSLSAAEVSQLLALYGEQPPDFEHQCADLWDVAAILVKLPTMQPLPEELRSQMLTACRLALSIQKRTDNEIAALRRENNELRDVIGLHRSCN